MILYLELDELKKSIDNFMLAVKADPTNDVFLYNLGVAQLNVGSKSKAKDSFKRSMELDNNKACREYRELTARTKYYKRSRCCDGTTSSALGRGACSHHGGVCRIENVPYKDYTINCK